MDFFDNKGSSQNNIVVLWYNGGMIDEVRIQRLYQELAPVVGERVRRLVVAAEALAIGRGGQAAVARATGVSRMTIRQGMRELRQPDQGTEKGRIRRVGGGRKRTVEHDPKLREDLGKLVEPTTRGDPFVPSALDLQERAPAGG